MPRPPHLLAYALLGCAVLAQQPRPVWYPDQNTGALLAIDAQGRVQVTRSSVGNPSLVISDGRGPLLILDGQAPRAIWRFQSSDLVMPLPGTATAATPVDAASALVLVTLPFQSCGVVRVQSVGVSSIQASLPGRPMGAVRLRTDLWVVATRESSGLGWLFAIDVRTGAVLGSTATPAAATGLARGMDGTLLVAGISEDAIVVLRGDPTLAAVDRLALPGPTAGLVELSDGTVVVQVLDPLELHWLHPSGSWLMSHPVPEPTVFETWTDGSTIARWPMGGQVHELHAQGLILRAVVRPGLGRSDTSGIELLLVGDVNVDHDGDGFTSAEELRTRHDPLSADDAAMRWRQVGPSFVIEAPASGHQAFGFAIGTERDPRALGGVAGPEALTAALWSHRLLDRPYGWLNAEGSATAHALVNWSAGVYLAVGVIDPTARSGIRVLPAAEVRSY